MCPRLGSITLFTSSERSPLWPKSLRIEGAALSLLQSLWSEPSFGFSRVSEFDPSLLIYSIAMLQKQYEARATGEAFGVTLYEHLFHPA